MAQGFVLFGFMGGLVGALYWELFLWLWEWWRKDPLYSFGPLVPLVSLYLLWERRKEWGALPAPSCPWGLGVGGIALLLQVLALWWDVHFLSGWSLVLLVGGIGLLLQGWERMRAWAFPYLFLFLAIPFPIVPLEVFSLPLQVLSARLAALVGNAFLGLGIEREGVVLHTGGFTFAVEAACSGLKNIVAMVTLAVLLAGLWEGQALWKRVLLVLSAPGFAIGANAIRIVVVLCIGRALGQEVAQGFFHEASGLVVFGVALMGILLGMEGLRRVGGKGERREARREVEEGKAPLQRRHPRWALGAMLGLLALANGMAYGWLYPLRMPMSEVRLPEIPLRCGPWVGEEVAVEPKVYKVLRASLIVARRYHRGEEVVEGMVVIGRDRRSVHLPSSCYRVMGWLLSPEREKEVEVGGKVLRWREFQASKGSQKGLVWYTFSDGFRVTPSWLLQQWYAAWRKGVWAQLHVTAPLDNGGEEAARERVQDFLEEFLPHVLEALRRAEA